MAQKKKEVNSFKITKTLVTSFEINMWLLFFQVNSFLNVFSAKCYILLWFQQHIIENSSLLRVYFNAR